MAEEAEQGHPVHPKRLLKLLIAQDTPRDVKLLVSTLKQADFELTFDIADSSMRFHEYIIRNNYDMVLSDHRLDSWTGMDALAALQASGKKVPFVVISGGLGEEAAVEYLKRGAVDYIPKHRLQRLPLVVEQALRDKARREKAAHLQETIRRGKVEWEMMFDTVPDPVFLLDTSSRIRRANRAAAKLLGVKVSELIGRDCCEVLCGRDPCAHGCPMERMSADGRDRGDIAHKNLGGIFDISTTPLRDEDGVLLGSVRVLRDITDRKRAEETIRRLAYFDQLTGLPNRALLQDRLQQTLAAAHRATDSVAVLLLDMNHFKKVNDTLGHSQGDILLQQIGPRLRTVLREIDTVARLGGDEFVVLLPSAASKDAEVVAQKILKALEPPFVIEDHPIVMQASIGVALYPDHAGDVDTLIQRADEAMYAAKRSGAGYAMFVVRGLNPIRRRKGVKRLLFNNRRSNVIST